MYSGKKKISILCLCINFCFEEKQILSQEIDLGENHVLKYTAETRKNKVFLELF
jgi:hypothetical protein